MNHFRSTLLTMTIGILACGSYWIAYKKSLGFAMTMEIDAVSKTETAYLEPHYSLFRMTPRQWSPAVAVLFEPARRIDAMLRPDVWSPPSPRRLTEDEVARFAADDDPTEE